MRKQVGLCDRLWKENKGNLRKQLLKAVNEVIENPLVYQKTFNKAASFVIDTFGYRDDKASYRVANELLNMKNSPVNV